MLSVVRASGLSGVLTALTNRAMHGRLVAREMRLYPNAACTKSARVDASDTRSERYKRRGITSPCMESCCVRWWRWKNSEAESRIVVNYAAARRASAPPRHISPLDSSGVYGDLLAMDLAIRWGVGGRPGGADARVARDAEWVRRRVEGARRGRGGRGGRRRGDDVQWDHFKLIAMSGDAYDHMSAVQRAGGVASTEYFLLCPVCYATNCIPGGPRVEKFGLYESYGWRPICTYCTSRAPVVAINRIGNGVCAAAGTYFPCVDCFKYETVVRLKYCSVDALPRCGACARWRARKFAL
jgi:hypothetical protein